MTGWSWVWVRLGAAVTHLGRLVPRFWWLGWLTSSWLAKKNGWLEGKRKKKGREEKKEKEKEKVERERERKEKSRGFLVFEF